MICIHEDILRQLGMDDAEIELLAAGFLSHGILPSPRFNFAEAGGRRPMELSPVDWLITESSPRRLLLVGMRDGFGAGEKIAAGRVSTIHVAKDGSGPAELTQDERAQLVDLMRPYARGSAVEHALRDFFGAGT